MSKGQRIPPPNVEPRNLDELGRQIISGEGYTVYAWSPGRVGENVPATQVHFALDPSPAVRLVLRIKSARALDELVGVLLDYRKRVWGQGAPPA